MDLGDLTGRMPIAGFSAIPLECLTVLRSTLGFRTLRDAQNWEAIRRPEPAPSCD